MEQAAQPVKRRALPRSGIWDVIEISNSAVGHAPVRGGLGLPPQAATALPAGCVFAPLTAVPVSQWRALAERAIEPNGYYLPEWELAVDASARGRTNASALCAWSDPASMPERAARLIGLMPVIPMWRAYGIPLPALVSAHPYGTLCTPLLDRDTAQDAVQQLMREARNAGAHALVLRDMAIDGAAMAAIAEVLRQHGMHPHVLQCHVRACLDATRDADELLRDALGPKKLKELRRQRSRLSEHGVVRFDVARTPEDVAAAIEDFLTLETSGWKGRRGTALVRHTGDASFIRRASVALAETGRSQIVKLRSGPTPVAAAIVLRHQDRAFFFKIGIDERFAKYSPGVQLTLELTRHLCADPAIVSADSMASADHPMINPIWRGRFEIGDVLIPLRRGDPVVTLIHAALASRRFARVHARNVVHFIRGLIKSSPGFQRQKSRSDGAQMR
jgi:CelD/BcsL family acetyltransferase involved in cellulose biosynthesis